MSGAGLCSYSCMRMNMSKFQEQEFDLALHRRAAAKEERHPTKGSDSRGTFNLHRRLAGEIQGLKPSGRAFGVVSVCFEQSARDRQRERL